MDDWYQPQFFTETRGHRRPHEGQNLPPCFSEMPLVCFDWSLNRGVVAVFDNGEVAEYPNMMKLLDDPDLPRPCRMVGESTFDSFNLDMRRQVIERCHIEGIELLTVPARGNKRRREAAGFSVKESQSLKIDEEDAKAIRYAALHGAHLKRPALPDKDWIAKREAANNRLMELRRGSEWQKKPRSRGYSRTSHKDVYAQNLIAKLPPFVLQPDVRKISLGPAEYNKIIVAAVGVASEFADNRDECERLMGIYAHGYPSQFRSDLMYWGWGKQKKKQDNITLSDYRRELRWLYHQVRLLRHGIACRQGKI